MEKYPRNSPNIFVAGLRIVVANIPHK